PLTDLGGKTSIFSHPVYLFLREFSLQDFRGGSKSRPIFVQILQLKLGQRSFTNVSLMLLMILE
ncbi:hypothetical protein E4534_25510, partial [Escherichia coli]|nr:hypothetical protein [Escherichia coli]